MLMKKTVVLLLAICLSLAAQAADKKGQFAIKGIGNSTCKSFVASMEKEGREKLESYLFAGWLNGYLTAQNQQLNETFDLINYENVHTLGNYMLHYCKQHPDKSFYLAVTSLLGMMYGDRIQEFTMPVIIRSKERSVVVYKSMLVRAQNKLKELGLYTGAPNGVYDSKSRKAFKAYQEKKGLPITELPDQATLFKLFPKGKARSSSQ